MHTHIHSLIHSFTCSQKPMRINKNANKIVELKDEQLINKQPEIWIEKFKSTCNIWYDWYQILLFGLIRTEWNRAVFPKIKAKKYIKISTWTFAWNPKTILNSSNIFAHTVEFLAIWQIIVLFINKWRNWFFLNNPGRDFSRKKTMQSRIHPNNLSTLICTFNISMWPRRVFSALYRKFWKYTAHRIVKAMQCSHNIFTHIENFMLDVYVFWVLSIFGYKILLYER